MSDLLKNTHMLIVVSACSMVLIGTLYVALYGLIHDGTTGQAILTWFENLLVPIFIAGTSSTAISQVADVVKTKILAGSAASMGGTTK